MRTLEPGSSREDARRRRSRPGGRSRTCRSSRSPPRPKGKTLELFGRLDPATDRHEPFHLYSMRQAIEEGFIQDVLANYTTYETLLPPGEGDRGRPPLRDRAARPPIARFVTLHELNLDQKAAVIVDHFRNPRRRRDRRPGQSHGRVLTHASTPCGSAGVAPPTSPNTATTSACSSPSPAPSTRPAHRSPSRHERLPRHPDRPEVRHRRVPHPGRGREVPDRLRPAPAPHHVRGQDPAGLSRRPDPLPAQPHPPRQGRHLRSRLPSTTPKPSERVRAVLRRDRRPTVGPEPALRHPHALDEFGILRADEITDLRRTSTSPARPTTAASTPPSPRPSTGSTTSTTTNKTASATPSPASCAPTGSSPRSSPSATPTSNATTSSAGHWPP